MSANDWGGVELEEEHNSNNVADEGFDVSENVHCSLDLYRSGYWSGGGFFNNSCKRES